jgi:hypothetical protein
LGKVEQKYINSLWEKWRKNILIHFGKSGAKIILIHFGKSGAKIILP